MSKKPGTYYFTKQKMRTAVLLIWIFAAMAVAFVYAQNKKSFTAIITGNKTAAIAEEENKVIAAATQKRQYMQQGDNSYVLIRYNKKLMFTRYSDLIADENFSDSVINNSTGKIKPLIIRRNRNKPAAEKNGSFDIKPVPK
jgi:hypothetical protein